MTDIVKETSSILRCADCGTVLAKFRELDAEEAEKVAAKHQCSEQVLRNLKTGHRTDGQSS